MDSVVKFRNQEALNGFRDFVFRSVGANDHATFSAALINAHNSGRNLTAEVQDKIMASDEFQDFCSDPSWKVMAADALNAPEDEVIIVFPHLRLDLPRYFSEDETKMSLPWHQEAGYYLPKGSCSPKSIVISTYLHDCNRTCGALELGSEDCDGLEWHNSSYMDEEGKRFKRVECSAPKHSKFKETRYGESVIFDFLIPHRSGRNETNDAVRSTLIVRASWTKDVEEWQGKNTVSK